MTVVDISSEGKVRASDILCCWETETGVRTICQTAQSVTGPGEGSKPPIRGEYFVYDLNDNTAPNIVQRHWGRRSFHYDNCAIAMITLFAVQTSEGWIE